MLNVAILASGNPETGEGGSTMDRFVRDVLAGKAAVNVGLIICNNSIQRVPGFYARIDKINQEFGVNIPVETINSSIYPEGKLARGQTLAEAEAICHALDDHDIDFALGQGYMKIGTGRFADEWFWKPEYAVEQPETNGIYHPKARAGNNHPGWLSDNPGVIDTKDTHGIGASKRIVERQMPYNAYTFHLMSDQVDAGPKIAEELVYRLPNDTPQTLFDRTQDAEKENTVIFIGNHLSEWEARNPKAS